MYKYTVILANGREVYVTAESYNRTADFFFFLNPSGQQPGVVAEFASGRVVGIIVEGKIE